MPNDDKGEWNTACFTGSLSVSIPKQNSSDPEQNVSSE